MIVCNISRCIIAQNILVITTKPNFTKVDPMKQRLIRLMSAIPQDSSQCMHIIFHVIRFT